MLKLRCSAVRRRCQSITPWCRRPCRLLLLLLLPLLLRHRLLFPLQRCQHLP